MDDTQELDPTLEPIPEPKKNKPKRSLMSGMAMTFLRNGGVAVIQFVVMILISRYLSKEQMGFGTAAIILANFSTMLSQMGIAPAIVQLRELDRRHLSSGFLAITVSGLLQTAAVLAFAPLFAGLMKMPEVVPLFRAVSFVFVLNAVSRVATMVLTRELEFGKLTKAELVSNVAYGGVTVGLAIMGYQAWAVVWGLIVQSLLLTVMILAKSPIPWPLRFDREAYRELMSVAKGFSLSTILNFIANQADQVIVGRYLGAAQLGVYSRAYNLMARPASLLALSINRVLFPTMARSQDDVDELVSLYRKTTAGIAMLVLPTGFISAVLAPEIVHVLLGPRWDDVILPYQILAAGMLCRVGNQSSDALVRAIGNAMGRVGPSAVFAVTTIALSILGTRYGLVGVAWMVLLSHTIKDALLAHVALKKLPIGWWDFLKAHQASVVVGLAAALAAWGVAEPMRGMNLPNVVVLFSGLASATVAAVAVVRLGGIRVLGPEAVQIRHAVVARVRKRKGGKAGEGINSGTSHDDKAQVRSDAAPLVLAGDHESDCEIGDRP